MKSFKRIVTLLLAFVMVLSMAVPAFALSFETIGDKVKIIYKSGTSKETDTKDIEGRKTEITLFTASQSKFTKTDYELVGWKIDGEEYDLGEKFIFKKEDYSTDGEYYEITAEAIWEEKGSSGSGSSSSKKIVGTYKPGDDAEGTKFKENYTKKYSEKDGYYIVTFPDADDFDGKGRTFKGWIIEGDDSKTVYKPGDKIAVNENFTATAKWSGKISIGDDESSSGSSSSSSSKTSSSNSSAATSSSSSSSTSSSSVPASSSSSSSVPASSSSKPQPSSAPSSSSVPESSSEPEVPAEPEVPEQPEEPTPAFKPTTLAYNINGDIPISGIKFDVNEDIGGVPSLFVSVLDSNSATDATTADFISSGNALAAFDISMLRDGSNYSGPVNGVLTYELNGTQATAISNFEEYIIAMVHVTSADKFEGNAYYVAEGKKVYLYDTVSGNKSEVGNISFEEKDGVYRPVIADTENLGAFAYQSKEGTIVEVKPLADNNASSVSMDVTSLSPFLIVHLEKGKAASAGGGFPTWIIIVIAVVVLAAAAVAVFFFTKNKGKPGKKKKDAFDDLGEDVGAGITGLDE